MRDGILAFVALCFLIAFVAILIVYVREPALTAVTCVVLVMAIFDIATHARDEIRKKAESS